MQKSGEEFFERFKLSDYLTKSLRMNALFLTCGVLNGVKIVQEINYRKISKKW
jgi:hypothetical protein